ncbi:MAG: methionyl-tRNA formyltransferase [Thermomicrobiales bacterium]
MVKGLRVVTFNAFLPAYQLVAEWAERHEHRLVLLVTVPSALGERYGSGHPALLDGIPGSQDVLITTRPRRTAAPVIAALEPDLIVSATFPRRIPSEVTAIPRFGAVNLHPGPLPRGRGPNPVRLIYEGDEIVGATLHRIAPDFDAGAILSRREQPLPSDVTGAGIRGAWIEMLQAVLEEGTARAIAGEPGVPQDESLASYAAPFTKQERWLSWHEPARTVQRRAAALNLLEPLARSRIDGEAVRVLDVRTHEGAAPAAEPGTVLARDGNMLTVRVADGVVEATIHPEPLSTPTEMTPSEVDAV